MAAKCFEAVICLFVFAFDSLIPRTKILLNREEESGGVRVSEECD